MTQEKASAFGTLDPRSILSLAPIYRLFVRMVIGDYRSVAGLVGLRGGERVLDLGCGPADILSFLPRDIEYVGIDMSEKYLDAARKRFGDRGQFRLAELKDVAAEERGQYDVVMALGVLHHIPDDEAKSAFALARTTLRPNGRFFSIDPCIEEGQSPIARFIVSNDRGQHVRTRHAYEALARTQFGELDTTIRHDLLRVPYTHFIMRCSGVAATSPTAEKQPS